MKVGRTKEKARSGKKEITTHPATDKEMGLYLHELATFLLDLFAENKDIFGDEYEKQNNTTK